jgi:hypothetical protein
MTDALAPAPSPAPDPAPAVGAPDAPPAAAERPAYIPEQFWDGATKAVKVEDFGKHYNDLTVAAAKLAERAAAVPAKPEDYKIEVKLPDGVTLPEGVKIDPSKDPRTPEFLKVAHTLGFDNNQVNQLIAFDAQLALAGHNAELARVAEETKKLGEKATDRIAAVMNWTNALKDRGFSDDERAEIRAIASSAAGVSALEKMIAQATGAIPGHVPTPPSAPQLKSHADRIWPTGFSSTPQAKVG